MKANITNLVTEAVREIMDDFSIDDILRELIDDCDLMEVVSCLDRIANESGYELEMYKDDVDEDCVRVYPEHE